MIAQKENTIVNKQELLFTSLLLLSMIGNVYIIKPINISYGEVLILIGAFAAIILSKFKIRLSLIDQRALLFIVYAVLITIINAILYPNIILFETIKRLIRDGFYWIALLLFANSYFNARYAFKLLNMISYILSAYIIIQFFAYILFGLYVPGILPGFSIDAGDAASFRNKALADAAILGYIRPNGFFAEPAQCAHLLSFVLYLNLFNNKSNKWLLAFISIAIIFTTSLNGIILMLFVYFMYYCYSFNNLQKKSKISSLVSFPVVASLVFLLYRFVPFVHSVIDRLSYLGDRTTGSVAMRVLRGPMFFMKMPIPNKLIGIGFGNFLGYRDATGIWTEYEENVEYFGMDAYFLISVGIIGVCLLLYFVFNVIKNKSYFEKGIIAFLAVAGLSSSIYSTSFLVIVLSFVLFNNSFILNNGKVIVLNE